MYNTCLACAPLHFTTPSHFQSFSFPFPASGWKGQLLSTWDEWESEFVQREVTGTVSRSRIPSSGEQLWAEAFLLVLYLLESFSGKNGEIKMKCQRLKSLGSSKSPLIPCFQRAEIIQMRSSFSTERQTALNSFIQFHHVFFFKTRLQRRCLNEWQPEH